MLWSKSSDVLLLHFVKANSQEGNLPPREEDIFVGIISIRIEYSRRAYGNELHE